MRVERRDNMKTNEIEKELGLTKHTIRYYEKEGLIHPRRDENGYRDYSEEDLNVLRVVKFLRNLDISIDDVKGIINGELNFQECLKVNQIHFEKHIEDLKEVKKSIDYYHDKDIPFILSLSQIEIKSSFGKLGFQKTTKTISLGRKLTRALAIRRIIYTIVPSLFVGFVGIFLCDFAEMNLSTMLKAMIYIICFLIAQVIFIASSFQFTSLYLGDTIDHSMNQSIEFLNDGICYYQFNGFISNLKYFFAVLFGKDEKLMHKYRYEDIEEVVIDSNRRYVKLGSPIAYETYVPDFSFTFHDQQKFYFYWPLTLDDDMRYIAYILDDKVKNIKDPKHILYALKHGIQLNDYLNEL